MIIHNYGHGGSGHCPGGVRAELSRQANPSSLTI